MTREPTLREAIAAAPFRSVLFPASSGATGLHDCPPVGRASFIIGKAPLPADEMAIIIEEIEDGLAAGHTVLLLALDGAARDEVKAELARRAALAATPAKGVA